MTKLKQGPLRGNMVPRLTPGRSVLRVVVPPHGYQGGELVVVRGNEPFGLCLEGDAWPDYNPTRFAYMGELAEGTRL